MAEYVNLNSARLPEQREVMEGIVEDGVCPFCIESLRKYHRKPIVREGEHWLVTPSQWPYKNTQRHYLLIARQHVDTPIELPSGAFEELGEHVKWLIVHEQVAYGGLAMRFGDTTNTGASVSHLHAHIIQATDDLPEGEKVRVKFSK